MNEDFFYVQTMEYISAKYKSLKKQINKGYKTIKKGYTLDDGLEFLNTVERIVTSLPDEYEEIILNDYLDKRQLKWWTTRFSKSSYYRKKSKAIKEFVDCFKI